MKFSKENIKFQLSLELEFVKADAYREALRELLKLRKQNKRLKRALCFLQEKIFTDDDWSADDAIRVIDAALRNTPEPTDPAPFKVGDKVQPKAYSRPGVITKFTEEWPHHLYRVDFDNGGYLWFRSKDLEHAD